MNNFNLHSFFKKQYLNESLEINLKDLNFDMLIDTYPENYKEEIISRFGDVKISLKPESENWFDKAEILDDKFQDTKDKIGKGKASSMKKDMERGWSID